MNNPEVNRSESEGKSEKQENWDNLEKKFGEESDTLGHGIEPGISKTVVGLNANNINTSQSCEGHTDWGRITPWVDVEYPGEPQKFPEEDKIYQEVSKEFGLPLKDVQRSVGDVGTKAWLEAQKRLGEKYYSTEHYTPEYKEWLKKNDELWIKTDKLVQKYNEDREATDSVRIKFSKGTIYNGGRDYYSGDKKRTEKQKKSLEKRLEKYREEFQNFSQFLKDKYFSQ